MGPVLGKPGAGCGRARVVLEAARDKAHGDAGGVCGADGADFGLIHADVLRENVLVDRRRRVADRL